MEGRENLYLSSERTLIRLLGIYFVIFFHCSQTNFDLQSASCDMFCEKKTLCENFQNS